MIPHPTIPMPAAPHRGTTIIPTHTHGAAVIRGTKGPAPLRSVCARAVVGLLESVVPSAGPAASRDMCLLHRPAPHGARATRIIFRVSDRSIDGLGAAVPFLRTWQLCSANSQSVVFEASTASLPAVRCAYNVSIYNLEAVEISVCSKHSAGEKWPQPWTAGRTVISNPANSELFLQIDKFCGRRYLCIRHGFGCQRRILFASQSRTMCLTRFGIVLRRARHGLGQGFDSCRPHLEASHLSFFAFFLLKTQRGP